MNMIIQEESYMTFHINTIAAFTKGWGVARGGQFWLIEIKIDTDQYCTHKLYRNVLIFSV